MTVFGVSSSVIPKGGYGGKYESPWGKNNPPSWSGDYDWKGASGGINWGGGFKVAGEDKTDLASTFSKLFDKANEEKYRKKASSDEAKIGQSSLPGSSGQVLDNLSAVYPQQHAPVYVPGVEGKRGFGSTIGGIVGAIGGSFIPGVGTGLGATLGSGVGGFFG
jgi:hypothetical protein